MGKMLPVLILFGLLVGGGFLLSPLVFKSDSDRLMVPFWVNCNLKYNPAGQADPPMEPEPMAPVWCFDLRKEPTTRVSTGNSWVDEFNTNVQMGALNDGDMDYKIFNNIEHSDKNQSLFFVNNDHWMVDIAGGQNGGALLSPNRSFKWESGKLVIEADVAAAIPEYEDSASVEIDVTNVAAPTGKVVDLQYGYGLFGGKWSFGCRFQADRQVVCALYNPTGVAGNPVVFGNENGRVWQMLSFQPVAKVKNYGGDSKTDDNGKYWRQCQHNQMDLLCRDRFRLELTKDSVKAFVNEHLYFEQSGLEPAYQFPDELVNGENYVYFTSWINRPLQPIYRFHWDRITINPKDKNGMELQPSTSDSFSK